MQLSANWKLGFRPASPEHRNMDQYVTEVKKQVGKNGIKVEPWDIYAYLTTVFDAINDLRDQIVRCVTKQASANGGHLACSNCGGDWSPLACPLPISQACQSPGTGGAGCPMKSEEFEQFQFEPPPTTFERLVKHADTLQSCLFGSACLHEASGIQSDRLFAAKPERAYRSQNADIIQDLVIRDILHLPRKMLDRSRLLFELKEVLRTRLWPGRSAPIGHDAIHRHP